MVLRKKANLLESRPMVNLVPFNNQINQMGKKGEMAGGRILKELGILSQELDQLDNFIGRRTTTW